MKEEKKKQRKEKEEDNRRRNISIRSFGCAANHHDADIIAAILENDGNNILETAELRKGQDNTSEKAGTADTIIVNICTVKGDQKSIREIKKTREDNPEAKIVITGCITQKIVEECEKIDNNISLIDTNNIDKIKEAIKGNICKVEGSKGEKIEKISLPVFKKNSVTQIILISEGCLNFCSFCSTKLIKGKVHSYPEEDILKSIELAVYNGAKEIWLTSQDNGAYGVDLYKRFAFGKLAQKIGSLRGTFFTRLGMANPDNVKKCLPDLIEAFRKKNIFRFIHIPLQSGNNRVLKSMNRTYTPGLYKNLVKDLRNKIPDITIATDVIVGFPGETEDEFEDTLRIIKETRPDIINISRYSEREGTKAAEMEQVHGRIRKERSRILTELYKKIAKEQNEKWIGWKGNIIIDEKGKNRTYLGRNSSYKQVVVEGSFSLGEIIEVEIFGASSYDLRGRALTD